MNLTLNVWRQKDAQDKGHIRIRAPSFMSVPDISQRKESNSAAGSRNSTDVMSGMAPLKLRSAIALLSPWAAEDSGVFRLVSSSGRSLSLHLRAQLWEL